MSFLTVISRGFWPRASKNFVEHLVNCFFWDMEKLFLMARRINLIKDFDVEKISFWF